MIMEKSFKIHTLKRQDVLGFFIPGDEKEEKRKAESLTHLCQAVVLLSRLILQIQTYPRQTTPGHSASDAESQVRP